MRKKEGLDFIISKIPLAEVEKELEEVRQFYSLVNENKNLFTQKKYSYYAPRFVYNAVKNSLKIVGLLKTMLKLLSVLEREFTPESKQKIFHALSASFVEVLTLFKENSVNLLDVRGRVAVEKNIVHEYLELVKRRIDLAYLESGDILFSFKSNEYLKTYIEQEAISSFTSSHITHILLVGKSSKGIFFVDSDRATFGVRARPFGIVDGEVFLAFRLRNISSLQRSLLVSKMVEAVKGNISYSKAKVAGLVPATLTSRFLSLFSRGYVLQDNWVKNLTNPEFFCSEFVNSLYKEIGVYLCPKSKYNAIVSPSDLVVSPYLEFLGLVFNDSEKTKEIIGRIIDDVKL